MTTRLLPLMATLGCVASAHAGDCVLFETDQLLFEGTMLELGIPLVSMEDFEDGNVGPNMGIGVDDPLDACSSNFVFPLGTIAPGMRLQSNDNHTPDVNDPGTSGLSPHGSSGLAALGPAPLIADKAITPTALGFSFNSLDVICLDDRYTGVRLDVGDIFVSGHGAIEVRVYDFHTEDLIGVTTIADADPAGVFLGIRALDSCTIGRVNLWAPGLFPCCGGDETVYEIGLYSVEPICGTDVNGDGEVAVNDLLKVLSGWGGSGPFDPNGDGTVDVVDILMVLSDWGPC